MSVNAALSCSILKERVKLVCEPVTGVSMLCLNSPVPCVPTEGTTTQGGTGPPVVTPPVLQSPGARVCFCAVALCIADSPVDLSVETFSYVVSVEPPADLI